MNLSRRDFFGQLMAAGLLATAPGCGTFNLCGCAKPKIGVQLYSVRDLCKKDLPATLRELARLGYSGVEYFEWGMKETPAQLIALSKEVGIKGYGSHIGYDALKPENLSKTFDKLNTLEIPGMCVPWLAFKTADEWKKAADTFNAAAEKAKARGLYIGYHNHQHEFKTKFDGVCAWQVFADRTTKDVVLEYDVGHVVAAGEDPVYWIKKYPGREKVLHAKELYGPGASGILGKPPAGQKGVDWAGVFAATRGVTEYYIVECETNPASYESVKGSIEFLKAQGLA